MPMRSIEEQTDRVRALESAALAKRAARKKALTRYGSLAAALLLVVGGVAAIAPRISGIRKSEAPKSNEPGVMTSDGFYHFDPSNKTTNEDCEKYSEMTSEMAEKPDEAPTDKWSTTDEALLEAVFGEVLEVQSGRLLLRLTGNREKDAFGEKVWVVNGGAGVCRVGQTVYCFIHSVNFTDDLPEIHADTIDIK